MDRFQRAMAGENTSIRAEEQRKDNPPAKQETQESKPEPETKKEPKESSVLPKEIAPKTPEKKEEPKKSIPSTEQKKVGTDGLTVEERKDLLAFKEKASRVDELEAKVKDHESTAKERDELKKLKEELEEKVKINDAKAKAFDIRSSQEFKEAIADPMTKLYNGMKELCKNHKIEFKEVMAALESPDTAKGNAALDEFMAPLDRLSARTFERIVNDMRDLNAQANEMMDRAPEAWEAIQTASQKKAEEQKVKDKETYRLANDTVLKHMQERFPFLSDKEVSAEVLKEANELDFAAMPPDVRAYYAQSGQVALRFNGILKERDAEIAQLKAALSKHQKEPGPTDGSSSTASVNGREAQDEDKSMDGMTTGQRFVAQFGLGKK